MRTLADEWADLRKLIPSNAPPVQFQETRRFFYAGARALMTLLLVNLEDTGDPDEVTPRDEGIMDALANELEQFGQDIKEGRA